ncbi:MAG: glycosyltransferase family 4 protein [Anaerolineae bacterium]
MPPLRILVVLTYYLPHRTGLTLHVQRVAEGLAQRGHSVTVLTTRFDKRLPRTENVRGVRVVRLWAPIRISRGMIMPGYPWALSRLLRHHDVVSLHTPLLESSLTTFLADLRRKPVVITHHGDLILPAGLLNRFIRWFVFQLYKPAARSAARLVAYSHDYAHHSYYLAPFLDKTSVIYPPICMPEPDPDRVVQLRRQWNVGDGHVIGYAGRFVEEKRPDLLIRALDTVNQSIPNTKLVFAGQHQLKYENFYERCLPLINRYRDQILFLGLLTSSQEMANFYAACDVLALPSDTECFGLVQIEAMFCGTPVVITDTPGAREGVRVTGMGRVVPTEKPQALGRALVDVMRNPREFVRSRSQVEQAYSFTETIDRYEKVFRNVVENRSLEK